MKKAKAAAVIAGLVSAGILGGFALTRADLSLVRTDLFVPIAEITADEMSDVDLPDTVTTTAAVTTVTAAKTTAVTSRTTAQTTAKATTTALTTTTAAETVTETTTEAETTASAATVTTAAPAPQTTASPPVTTAAPQPVWAAPVSTQPPQPVITEPVIPATEPETEPAAPQQSGGYAISVTDREYIMLCNVVGHEYGADWVPTAEKALIAECIMNRVNSPLFPNTVYDVLMQPGQFAGIEHLILMETMSKYVTQDVRDAVDLYLTHPEQFQHGYLFFSGDGYRSYFRTTY